MAPAFGTRTPTPMNLYLFRHGPAAEPEVFAGLDPERPLTSAGRKRVRQVARGMRALGLEFDLVLSSPYTRARQTAAVAARVLGFEDRLRLCAALGAGVDATQLVQALIRLRPVPANLMLVGHEPQLSRVASLLLSGGTSLELLLKKAGLGCLEMDRLVPRRCAALAWWLTSRQLARIAG